MRVHKNEILIFYNPLSSADRKTVAYAKSVTKHVVSYSFDKTPPTGTIWRTIIDRLGLHPKQLLNKANPYYQENIRGREFDEASWLNVLIQNPDLIKAAIAMRGSKAILCQNPTDVYRLTEAPQKETAGQKKRFY